MLLHKSETCNPFFILGILITRTKSVILSTQVWGCHVECLSKLVIHSLSHWHATWVTINLARDARTCSGVNLPLTASARSKYPTSFRLHFAADEATIRFQRPISESGRRPPHQPDVSHAETPVNVQPGHDEQKLTAATTIIHEETLSWTSRAPWTPWTSQSS